MSQFSFGNVTLPSTFTLPADSNLASSIVDPSKLWKSANLRKDPEDECWYSTTTSHKPQKKVTSKHTVPSPQQCGKIIDQIDIASECCTAPTPAPSPSPKQSSPSQQSDEEDRAKRKRVQKARNAANKRHSASKASRLGKGDVADAELAKEAEDPKQGRYREMNRIAAAKCRAKTKTRIEDLETRCGREAARHKHLKNQLLELRDLLTFLRDCSLQHGPSRCGCGPLREYNNTQARKLARSLSGSESSLSPS